MSFARKVARRFEQMRRRLHENPGHAGALLRLYEHAPRPISAEEGEQLLEASEVLQAELKSKGT